jgi:hypothetical protein
VRRIDDLLLHKTGEDSVSVAIQWLSQTLDWIPLWADTDHQRDHSFSAYESPVLPAFHHTDNSSMHWHP